METNTDNENSDRESNSEQNDDSELLRHRASLDGINERLFVLLVERFEITEELQRHKTIVGLPARDRAREREQIIDLQKKAEEVGLDKAFVKQLMQLIYDEVIKSSSRRTENNGGGRSEHE